MSLADLAIVGTVGVFVLIGAYFGAARLWLHGLSRFLIAFHVGYLAFLYPLLYARWIYDSISSQFNVPRAVVEVVVNAIILLAVATVVYSVLGRLKALLLGKVQSSKTGRVVDKFIGIPAGALLGGAIAMWAYAGPYQYMCRVQNARCVPSTFSQFAIPEHILPRPVR